MPKMIISLDGVVLREVQLTKDRVTLGRRPYNDIVIDNLAISGEHAVLHMIGADAPEIVQSLAVALTCGATKAQFDRTVAVHPTSAEEFVLMRQPTRVVKPSA